MSKSDSKRGEVRGNIKKQLIDAYESFMRREPGSMDRVLKLVNEFALVKLIYLEHVPDFRQFGSAETADDWAQEVSIKVWQELISKDSERTGEQFYAWVHKIAFNQAADSFNYLLDERATKVPLFVKGIDDQEDGEEHEIENPEIYEPVQQTAKRVKKSRPDDVCLHGPIRHIVKDGKDVLGNGDGR
jgi:hypothetical protein